MNTEEHKMPEQFNLDGIIYPGLMMSEETVYNAERFNPTPGDVLTVSYPRSGEFLGQFTFLSL